MPTLERQNTMYSFLGTIFGNSLAGGTASATSVLSAILWYMGVITTAAACIATVGGLVVLYFSITHAIHQKKMDKLDELRMKEEFKKYNL